MNRILFDTNVVSYWHAGDRRFKPPLHRLLSDLRRSKAAFYISAITIQELGHWAIPAGTWPSVSQFLSAARLHVLPFCAECAIQAARLQAQQGPVVARKSEQEEVKAQWHHDAAIVGTAAHHMVDMMVTTDRVLAGRYGGAFHEIRLIEPTIS